MLRHRDGLRRATNEIEQLFASIAVGYPKGADNRASSYLHVIVNYLEWQAIIQLIGDDHARKVMEFWCGDHYTEIYKLVLREHVRIGEIVGRFGLLPV